ncbi:hypothetical protein KPH14_005803 [Odynerus spinipes]|uniref:RING-type domain-containing protein n=1 Tax=Odynerus spinipes TaxID=1348599 RepID=A0AAD9RB37_9HYME|nr:hypothetical protein KPH14_005803 [Odynerus spinipes]
MNIVCVICSDLLVPSDDVFHTPCGHIFHFTCLIQWLERSKTCPQCRERTNQNKIHRIYFNFSNNDTIIDDASALQDKVDKLTFQILLKDKDIKHYMEKSETMEKQNVGLRSELKKAESKIREKETAIYALKEQIKFFREQCSEVDATKQEIAKLRQKVENLKNVQLLMDASAEEVDEMASRTNDLSTLVTYISIMKREMAKCVNKRREIRAKLCTVQQELTKVSMERNYLLEEQEKRKRLEQEIMACESEKMLLQNKLRDIENNERVKINKSNTMKAHKTCPSSLKMFEEEGPKHIDTTDAKKDTRCSQKRTGHFLIEDPEINSPDIPVQSQGILGLKEQYIARRCARSTFTILAKKPRLSQNVAESIKSGMITYDGFGGHSKYDRFPNPVPSSKLKKTCVSKPRKFKLDTGDNKKLSDIITDI